MGGGVVQHQVHVELGGDFAVEGAQELAELDRPMAGVQGTDDLAGGDVEGGVEARGAVADVVVAGPRRAAGQHRKDGLGAIESLDLGEPSWVVERLLIQQGDWSCGSTSEVR
ncbi:hypothetical protein FRP1_28940 (plasmid) [Pseudonocardia sp. EC080625-04]|nr:hypothetical protein FRP1_28940 [Pseudonocardia sp. EC080625-04]